jgi:hypothetical protein
LDESFKLANCLSHRKHHIVRPLAGGDELYLAHGEIKGASEVVDSITSNAHEVWRNGLARNEFQHVAINLCVMLYKDIVSVIAELQGAAPQISDMLFGPFDLQLGSRKS